MSDRVALYARVSTLEQGSDLQLGALRAWWDGRGHYIEERTDLHPEEYVDDGISGRVSSRPGLNRLRADIADGRVRAVVVTKLDRLGRSVKAVLEFFELCEQHEVRVVAVSQAIDTSTPAGRLTRTILAAIAEFETELISDRTQEAMNAIKSGARRTRSGKPPGRPRRVTPEVEARIRELRWPKTGKGLPWKQVAQYVHLPAGTCSKVPRTPREETPLSENGPGEFGEANGARADVRSPALGV